MICHMAATVASGLLPTSQWDNGTEQEPELPWLSAITRLSVTVAERIVSEVMRRGDDDDR